MILDGEIENIEELRIGYGFIESFSKPYDASSYSRINIVLDVVDAKAFDTGIVQERSPAHLSMVRIMTTQKRLEHLFDISSPIIEGDWFRIELGVHPGMPRAWVLEARNDYGGAVIALNLIGLLRVNGEGPNEAIGPNSKLGALRLWCKIAGRPAAVPAVITDATDLHVRVADVGHASFAAIHVAPDPASKIVGYFDVGGPVYFHHHTFPKAFKDHLLIPRDGFVALSHWDFDHYSLAVTKMKGLQNLTWYAPEQLVGPNAARLQVLLGARLNFVHTPTYHISAGLQMWQGSGALGDRNNSGYVFTVQNGAGGTLLTGDVAYDCIPAGAKTNLVALGVTHHGGSGAGSPPTPLAGSGSAAVSFGLPNRYHHPNWDDIAKHTLAGWHVQPTFVTPTNRGDVWLP
jgi:hypothetical protein